MNKNYYEILLETDINVLNSRNKKNLYVENAENVMGRDQIAEFPKNPTYRGKSHDEKDLQNNIEFIIKLIGIS